MFLLNPFRHGSAVIPPSAILTSDPYYSYRTVILQGDGSSGAVILDAAGNVWTKAGNAANDGSGSIAFDGTGDEIHMTRAQHATSNCKTVGTADFSVEMKIRISSLASDRELFCISHPGRSTSAFDIVFEVKTTGAIRGSVQNGSGSTNVDITSASSLIAINTDYNVSFDVEGTAARVRINGAVVASGTITGTRVQNQTEVRIGELSNTAGFPRYMNGLVKWCRVTAGMCANPGSGTVTPPSDPIPAWVAPVYQSRFTIAPTNDVQGIDSDGTNLFVTSSSTIYKYSKAGSLITSRSVTSDNPTTKDQINGIRLNGSTLYVVAGDIAAGPVATTWVVEYDASTLAYITHHTIAGDRFGEDIDFKDGYAWMVFHAHKLVAKIETSGWTVVATYSLDFPISSATSGSGGYGGTQGYESGRWYGNYFICNVHEIYDEEICDVYYFNGTTFDKVIRWGRPTTNATQGVAFDPSEAGVLWFCERSAGGDSIAKTLLT